MLAQQQALRTKTIFYFQCYIILIIFHNQQKLLSELSQLMINFDPVTSQDRMATKFTVPNEIVDQ